MKIYRQRDGYSCGPRSLQIAFSKYDFYPSYSSIFEVCETDISGTDVWDLEKAAKVFGFRTKVHSTDATTDLIKYHTDKQRPVIVMWYVGDQDTHVAVAYKVNDKYVHLFDPSLHLYTEPEIRIRRSMLERCWSNHEDARWIMAVYM